VNKVIISGNLGQKPEIRETKGGMKVGNFSVATNDRVKRDGEYVDETQWHRVVVFGKEAENCERFLDKGSKVLVEGRLRVSDYQDKEGNKRKSIEIISNRVEFMSKPQNGMGERAPSRPAGGSSYNDDEIPF